MNMNEKKALYAFSCPNREATVRRLRLAAALSPNPAAKKLFYTLSVRLCDENTKKWYRCFFTSLQMEMETYFRHKTAIDRIAGSSKAE